MVMNSLLVESSKISPTKNKSMFFPHGKITGTDPCFVSCWIVGGISIKFYIPTIFKAEIHRYFLFYLGGRSGYRKLHGGTTAFREFTGWLFHNTWASECFEENL